MKNIDKVKAKKQKIEASQTNEEILRSPLSSQYGRRQHHKQRCWLSTYSKNVSLAAIVVR
jgi:hypothetical protein